MVNTDRTADYPGMDVKHRVGVRVRAIRAERGLTQEDVAEMVERSVDAISNLERGVSLPSFETLERLSEGLGVPIRDFFDDPKGRGSNSPVRLELEARLLEIARGLSDQDLSIAVEQIRALSRRGVRNERGGIGG